MTEQIIPPSFAEKIALSQQVKCDWEGCTKEPYGAGSFCFEHQAEWANLNDRKDWFPELFGLDEGVDDE